MIDEGLGFGNGFLLPAGPLREPKKHAQNADAIIVIRRENVKRKPVLPDGVPVFYATNRNIMPSGRFDRIVAFAGIGYPKKFFRALPNVVARRAFADHYQYTDKDIQDIMNLAKRKNAKPVTTEKDWVRLPEYARDKIKCVKLETVIEEKFFDWLKEKLNADDKKVC